MEEDHQYQEKGFEHSEISDTSNGDDYHRQILGLEEEKGIFTREEVVVPPDYETDEDRPIKGAEPPFNEPLQQNPSEQIMKEYDDEEEAALSDRMSLQNLPIKSEDADEEEAEYASEQSLARTPSYPPGSPPAYYSDEEDPSQQLFSTNVSGEGASALIAAATGGLTMGKMLLTSTRQNQPSQQKRPKEEEQEEEVDEDLHEDLGDSWHTNHSKDVQELLSYGPAFKPEEEDIETSFMSFVVDMVPAVGDIDVFIKIPRPDRVFENSGLVALDEPAAKQSDPVIIDMQMRTAEKVINKEGTSSETVPTKKVQRAHRDTQQIERWIESIKELHQTRPTTTVLYTKPMPDIEKLMQEWPTDVEKALHDVQLPTADLDVPLEEFVDIILSLCDIPLHKSRIESLHVLFSLYAEFKNSQHFANIGKPGTTKANVQRMEL